MFDYEKDFFKVILFRFIVVVMMFNGLVLLFKLYGFDNSHVFAWEAMLKYFWLFELFVLKALAFIGVFILLIYLFVIVNDAIQESNAKKKSELVNREHKDTHSEVTIPMVNYQNTQNEIPIEKKEVLQKLELIPEVKKETAADIKRRVLKDLNRGSR